MKFTQPLVYICLVLVFSSCLKNPNTLSPINSESFNEKQIQINFQLPQAEVHDSLVTLIDDQTLTIKKLDEMLSLTDQIRQSGSDSLWAAHNMKWTEFQTNYIGTNRTPYSENISTVDSLKNKLSPEASLKWAELNVSLVKLSGEVRFGDALEILLYNTKEVVLPAGILKSVIFTHIADKIFVNVIGSSSMDYQHTTGGNVKLIQETNYPQGNEMTLECECNDLRYMDIFIRIPSWAVNPSVSHGNVKYVARPGEYSQISKKWKTGDLIEVSLRN